MHELRRQRHSLEFCFQCHSLEFCLQSYSLEFQLRCPLQSAAGRYQEIALRLDWPRLRIFELELSSSPR